MRAVLDRAREEAAALRHEYVGTEHLLLGLLHSETGVATAVIESFDVDLQKIEAALEQTVKKGPTPYEPRAELPLTSRGVAVLALAANEARIANHSYIGPEHLLLGLLAEKKGIAAQLLVYNGITLAAARQRFYAILGMRGTAVVRRTYRSSRASWKFWSTPSPKPGMQGYNLTERLRLVIANARAQSTRLRHEYIGTEHLLLGLLLHADAGVGLIVIDSFGVDAADIATRLESAIKGGHGSGTSVDLPYTSRAKRALELAVAEATRLNQAYVGTEHLLLGLISEGDGIAAQMLREFGITLEPARDAVRKVLGDPEQAEQHRRQIVQNPAKTASASDPLAASARMAAAIIETLVRDPGVARVFAAQGVDIPELIAALRTRAHGKPSVERASEPSTDAPPPA